MPKFVRIGVRVTADANIWVSAVLTRTGRAALLMEAFLQERFTLVTSEPLLAEVAEVLARPQIARRSHLTPAEIQDLLRAMRVLGEIVVVSGEVELCRDPDDDVVIETARNGQADVLVTGDRDLIADPAVVSYLTGGQRSRPHSSRVQPGTGGSGRLKKDGHGSGSVLSKTSSGQETEPVRHPCEMRRSSSRSRIPPEGSRASISCRSSSAR